MSRLDDNDSWASDDDDDVSDDDDDIVESLRFYPLCCRTINDTSSFDTIADALQHDVETHGFDALQYLPPASDEDFFEKAIMLINKCRAFVVACEQEDIGIKLAGHLAENNNDDERFFRPVLDDDAMLMSIDELQMLKHDKQCGDDVEKEAPNNDSALALQMRISALEEQLERANACISSLTNNTTTMTTAPPIDNDSYYFSSYAHHSIHETMLQDEVRTLAYQKAILSNAAELFRNKVVLDIGCGTGVLSIFAAKAGARKVIAIDGSDIINDAREIVKANGYDNIITCERGKVEDLITNKQVGLEKDEKVDIIVSEWMGYALLFETMLPSVMVARDAVMKEGGTMYPNCANILLEGATDDALQYWNSVYNIDMSPMKKRVARELTKEASVEIVPSEKIVTNRVELVRFDLNTCKNEDLDFNVPFELEGRYETDALIVAGVKVDKLVVSFDIDFNVPGTNKVGFSTGCQSKPTHWKQTTLWFSEAAAPTLQQGEVMKGTFQMKRNEENHREMDFCIVWEVGMLKDDGSFEGRCDGVLTTELSA